MQAKPTEHFNFTALAITVGVLIILGFFIDMETVEGLIARAGIWAPLLFILLKASTVIVAPLSGAPLYPLVGIFFGFWPGILYVVIGDFIGFTTSFFIARRFGYPVVRRIIAHNEHGMLSRIVHHVGTLKGFLHMCLTCFALPELISYGTGLSRLPYLVFISILLPLSVVMSSALVLFGASLGASETSVFISFMLPFAGSVIILLGGYLFYRSVSKKEPLD